MTETPSAPPEPPDHDRVVHRAGLLPEERVAGNDDPERAAEIILEDSDARAADPKGTKHRSVQSPG